MRTELKDRIEKALKTLRQADNQAAAVAWMANAYKLLEECLTESMQARQFFFVPDRPQLEIVQSIPKTLSKKQIAAEARYAHARAEELRNASLSRTVVYPSVFLPPGLKPLPKPWTREDQRRLERAAATPVKRIQRLGK